MTQTNLLDVEKIEVGYGGVLAVANVSLTVAPGEIVALLGANGAGKSTTLKAISGLIAADRGQVRRGKCVSTARTAWASPPTGWQRAGWCMCWRGGTSFRI